MHEVFGNSDPVLLINSIAGLCIAATSLIGAITGTIGMVQSRKNGRTAQQIVGLGHSNARAIETTRAQNVDLAMAVDETKVQNDNIATAVNHVHVCVETRNAELKDTVERVVPAAVKEAVPAAIKAVVPRAIKEVVPKINMGQSAARPIGLKRKSS